MEKVRIGIVGVGWIAQVIHLPILMKLPEAEVIAICDKDKARVRLVGEKFGIKNQFTDLNQMLAMEGLEACGKRCAGGETDRAHVSGSRSHCRRGPGIETETHGRHEPPVPS